MIKMKPTMVLLGAMALSISCAQAAETKTNPPPVSSSLATNLFPDKVVVKAKSFQIKRSQVEEIYTGYKASAAAQGQMIGDDKRAGIESKILDQLIAKQLLMNRANADDKAKAKTKGDEVLANYLKSAPSEEAFTRQLTTRGMTLDQFKGRIQEGLVCEEVVDRDLKSKVTVTDEQTKKFYDDNGAQFEEPERVRASHILIGTQDPVTRAELSEEKKKEKRQLADKLLERAKKGEDFAKLAKENSDDPGSRDKGGEYTFGRGQMMPEFEKTAFALEPGKISDIVTTSYGYHIIKLSEKLPAKKSAYADISTKIKEQMVFEETQKKLPDYIEKLKKDDGVEIVDAKEASKP